MNPMDGFFNLGNRLTKNDPLLKARYDYVFYWMIFVAFVFIAGELWINFLFDQAPLSTLAWAVIITLFCWFNYQALAGFRSMYLNLKAIKGKMEKQEDEPIEGVNEMLGDFTNELKGGEQKHE